MKLAKTALIGWFVLGGFVWGSCSETDASYDPYHDWQARNARWFTEKYDSATNAINEAKKQYPTGNEWEQHCEWRLLKTLLKSPTTTGTPTDYVVCKILKRGTGEQDTHYTDSVMLHYRGFLMDKEYPSSQQKQTIFSQTYYGNLDPSQSAPIAMPVKGTVEGFQTALQYMHAGDDWQVYIPQQLGYKEKASDAIPAYSTLLFRLTVHKVHKNGTGTTEWK